MAELTRPAHQSFAPGSGADDPFDTGHAGVGMVTVSSGGLFNENLPVANVTVGEIRRRFRDRLDIDPNSRAEIDARPVDDDEVVRAGQLLTFVRHSGEKGRRAF